METSVFINDVIVDCADKNIYFYINENKIYRINLDDISFNDSLSILNREQFLDVMVQFHLSASKNYFEQDTTHFSMMIESHLNETTLNVSIFSHFTPKYGKQIMDTLSFVIALVDENQEYINYKMHLLIRNRIRLLKDISIQNIYGKNERDEVISVLKHFIEDTNLWILQMIKVGDKVDYKVQNQIDCSHYKNTILKVILCFDKMIISKDTVGQSKKENIQSNKIYYYKIYVFTISSSYEIIFCRIANRIRYYQIGSENMIDASDICDLDLSKIRKRSYIIKSMLIDDLRVCLHATQNIYLIENIINLVAIRE